MTITLLNTKNESQNLLQALNHQKVAIVTNNQSGNGALSCSFKLASLIRDRGGIPSNQLLISSDSADLLNTLFNHDNQFRVIPTDELAAESNIGLIIVVYHKDKSDYRYACLGSPVLFLNEYNKEAADQDTASLFGRHIAERALGLQPCTSNPLGLMIDTNLEKWSDSTVTNDPVKKAEKLLDLNRSWKKLLLGGQTPEEFAASSRLYFGYARHKRTKQSYLTALCEADKGSNTQNLIVILPGGDPFQNLRKLPVFIERQLKKSGIGFLVLIENYPTRPLETLTPIVLSQTSNKRLTIIFGSIKHSTTTILLHASDEIVLTAGEQSFSEAASARKRLIYEARSHNSYLQRAIKQELGYSIVNPEEDLKDLHSKFVDHIFHTPLTKDQTQRKLRSVIEQQDCAVPILKLMEELVETNKGTVPRTQNLSKVPLSDFKPELLPFNIPTLINLKQFKQLKIEVISGISQLPPLNDSLFRSDIIGNDSALVLREKKARL